MDSVETDGAAQQQIDALAAYTDLRDQVIRALERWRDVKASVALSPWTDGPATGAGSMFVATIRWEYRVRPTTPTVRFACVADRDEFDLDYQEALAEAGRSLDPAGVHDTVEHWRMRSWIARDKQEHRRVVRRAIALSRCSLGGAACWQTYDRHRG